MTSLADRMNALSLTASFTMKDMATWCECDKSAIREWMKHGVTPHPLKARHLDSRLGLLERAIKKLDTLPVPMHIKQYDRAQYVKQVRDHALKKLSKPDSSTTGV